MTLALRMFTSLLVRELWHGLDDTTIVGSFGVTLQLFFSIFSITTVSNNSRQLFREEGNCIID